ncbi:16S rRNA pseudouridine(516) synthase [Anaerococcus sp. AGMB00486]|uniref:16S rRNA pseudouridine(516) synthase n=2 Tax=Anaerococcus TaxID=165779 RepID=A0ABX2NBI9_9FIRM|nr:MULTISPECIES: pseudouridine synthase [Anaerococcus]MDY3006643.1 pseudouridine synthase [Anaerococcus porci]MSS78110.1 16S rRNA pseudouridine(516) synthase [Anaerococcus porci]NVF12086.1 16S rRNA pseudouridine(516) synthase [Anaerococcus faecalis]
MIMRVDKMIGNANLDTRKNIKRNAKKGALLINGEIIKDSSTKVDPNVDEVVYMGELVDYFDNIYIMMNKREGLICQSNELDGTVMQDLDDFYLNLDISIVGRLDKDTTGLLLMSTDGKFVHKLISPNSNIWKKYEVETSKKIDPSLVEIFRNGVYIKEDDYTARSAKLEILDERKAYVYVTEGRFHLVKRLFSNNNNEVIKLRRLAIGDLELDSSLNPGQYRELSKEELNLFI